MMPMKLLCLSCLTQVCFAEWVIVNLIRHGERYDDKSNKHLHPFGLERAKYIAKCVTTTPSLAFPLGLPVAMLASLRDTSFRPKETLDALHQKTGIRLDNHIQYKDVKGFQDYVNQLHHGQTLFVAWQHKLISKLAASFDVGGLENGLTPSHWPKQCLYNNWEEPESIQEGACYDVIWQLVLHRSSKSESYRTKAFSHLHMGFAGNHTAPCSESFRPYSNPAHWEHYDPDGEGSPRAKGAQLFDDPASNEGEEPQITATWATYLLSMAVVWMFGLACGLGVQKKLHTRRQSADRNKPLLE
eukprot:TRINITY_DN63307_c0_g1_i1.p1 TRINITY_DN63307_c0_g1~~TRINITY_DN63307_c0_g1_i1.p1  ORF type:complete len:300 (+),score=48.06 TRINITY_DN63307_c0_g1_i1:96-995(+)